MRFARLFAPACAAGLWLAAMAAPAPAGDPAAPHTEPKCPLELHVCLERYTHMRERPWFGAWVGADSVTGERLIERLYPGGPVDRAGLEPGDRLTRIGGMTPNEWFAGKAGWRTGDRVAIEVTRAGAPLRLEWTLEPITEEAYAVAVGSHVVAGHLAYGDFGGQAEGAHRH